MYTHKYTILVLVRAHECLYITEWLNITLEYHYKGHEPYKLLLYTAYTQFDTLPLYNIILLDTSIIDHPRIITVHVPYCILGCELDWPRLDLDPPCGRTTQYLPLHNEYVHHTNSMQGIERQKFGGLSWWFIFPVLYSQALHIKHKFLTLSVKQMHHPTKGHSGIDYRSVIYFLQRKNNGQMIPPLHEAPLEYYCGGINKIGTTWTGKGRSFSWCRIYAWSYDLQVRSSTCGAFGG